MNKKLSYLFIIMIFVVSACESQRGGPLLGGSGAGNGIDSSGQLDATFGVGGKVGFVNAEMTQFTSKVLPVATAMKLQPDNKILLSGAVVKTTADQSQVISKYHLLMRLNEDGSWDRSFGDEGEVPFNTYCGRLAALDLDDQGRILAAGGGCDEFYITRLDSDGSIDLNFGQAGFIKELKKTAEYDSIRSIKVLSDQSIVVLVNLDADSQGNQIALFKYDSNGVADLPFGTNGIAIVSSGLSSAQSLSVLGNGDFIVTGQRIIDPISGTAGVEAVLIGVNKNGSLNTAFGSAGIQAYGHGRAQTVIERDGGLLLLADSPIQGGSRYFPRLGALDISGNLLSVFNEFEAITQTSFSAAGLGMDSKRNTLFGGFDGTTLTAVRLTPSGDFDTTFAKTGAVRHPLPLGEFENSNNRSNLEIDSKGRIVISGHIRSRFEGLQYPVDVYGVARILTK